MLGIELESRDLAEGSDNKFQEQISINIISGKKNLFIYPYWLFCIFFSLCIIFLITAAFVSFAAIVFDKAKTGDILAFVRIITSFDFSNSALKNNTGAEMNALAAAYGLTTGFALAVLALVFGFSIKTLKRFKINKKAVQALLLGRKRGFIPCSEGIYKLFCINLLTQNRFYSLYSWESLSLYGIEDAKKRVVLKAGKNKMRLEPWTSHIGQRDLFAELKSVVLGHLPNDKQVLLVKKDRYKWGRVAVAIRVIFTLQYFLAGWLETASNKGNGDKYCDVGGKIHFNHEIRSLYGVSLHTFQVYGENNKLIHNYCQLHGAVFAILHLVVYSNSMKRLMNENGLNEIIRDPILICFMLILPVMVWLYLIVIVISRR